MTKGIIYLGIILILVLVSTSALAGNSFSDLEPAQKQSYWGCIKDSCIGFLQDHQYGQWKDCVLNCLDEAFDFTPPQPEELSCSDSDEGADYLNFGIITDDKHPDGKEDYCHTFSSGKEYLFEGVCVNGKYRRYQKKCGEYGEAWSCEEGACVKANSAPVLAAIGNQEVNVGEEIIIELIGYDEEGDELEYSADFIPINAQLNENIFTWEPTEDQVGETELIFRVSDGELEDSKLITVNVLEVECDPWDKTFGGNFNDQTRSVQQTTDGGYILAGYTNSEGAGSYDFWILKLDPTGSLEWDKTFGGSDLDWAYSIQQTTDGGYIVAGLTKSKGEGSFDAWILKLNSEGDLEWDKTFGGSDYDRIYSIQQTTDGGYIATGSTNSEGAGSNDFWILKLDPTGSLEWDKTFGGGENDESLSIQQTTDGGYIATGSTNSEGAGSNDFWILKLDPTGSLEWNKTYGNNMIDNSFSSQQTSDEGYIVAGYTQTGIGEWDAWVLKLDPTGSLEWNKTFGGNDRDSINSVQQTTDEGYILAGYTNSEGAGGFDGWILKLDPTGSLEWNKTFGGIDADDFESIQQTTDGGYIATGSTNSKGEGSLDAWLLKLNSAGELECE